MLELSGKPSLGKGGGSSSGSGPRWPKESLRCVRVFPPILDGSRARKGAKIEEVLDAFDEPASRLLLRRRVRLVLGLDSFAVPLDEMLSERALVGTSEAPSIPSSVGSAIDVLLGLSTQDGEPPTDCDLLRLRLALRMSRRMKEPPFLVCGVFVGSISVRSCGAN